MARGCREEKKKGREGCESPLERARFLLDPEVKGVFREVVEDKRGVYDCEFQRAYWKVSGVEEG